MSRCFTLLATLVLTFSTHLGADDDARRRELRNQGLDKRQIEDILREERLARQNDGTEETTPESLITPPPPPIPPVPRESDSHRRRDHSGFPSGHGATDPTLRTARRLLQKLEDDFAIIPSDWMMKILVEKRSMYLDHEAEAGQLSRLRELALELGELEYRQRYRDLQITEKTLQRQLDTDPERGDRLRAQRRRALQRLTAQLAMLDQPEEFEFILEDFLKTYSGGSRNEPKHESSTRKSDRARQDDSKNHQLSSYMKKRIARKYFWMKVFIPLGINVHEDNLVGGTFSRKPGFQEQSLKPKRGPDGELIQPRPTTPETPEPKARPKYQVSSQDQTYSKEEARLIRKLFMNTLDLRRNPTSPRWAE